MSVFLPFLLASGHTPTLPPRSLSRSLSLSHARSLHHGLAFFFLSFVVFLSLDYFITTFSVAL
ncbi:hypothetical protein BDY24DRAFT_358234, partial [Mrakia frigida]|uniref:uncharacterized protein n=1 Tax=Mrakia frigida TaxID=29902 RepID=UPI003FCC1AD8